ncbi:MAG: nucleotide exchange factor GrpE [Vulcanimicrobiota bacterium]
MQERLQRLEARVLELERRLARLEGTPAPSEAATSRLTELLDELLEQAPSKLARSIGPTCREARELSLQDQSDARERLASQLIPELVELCENVRRTESTGELFYETLESRLDAIMAECGLEPIRPARGDGFQTVLHNAVRVVRGSERDSRDTIELCLSPGFRWKGNLLKKAEVTVFL